jgi:large subunit ribosomal protein L17
MRHLKAHRKLGRTSEHRMSMLRNLAVSLINSKEERIVTTLPKAKELRPFVEKAITLSRRARGLEGDGAEARALHLHRQAAGFFHAGNLQHATLSGKRGQLRPARTAGVAALKRLFDELGERFQDRPGGYTRILKLGHRVGDNAELAIIELVGNPREVHALEQAKKRARHTPAKKKKKALEAHKGEAEAGGAADKQEAAATETEVPVQSAERTDGDSAVTEEEK